MATLRDGRLLVFVAKLERRLKRQKTTAVDDADFQAQPGPADYHFLRSSNRRPRTSGWSSLNPSIPSARKISAFVKGNW